MVLFLLVLLLLLLTNYLLERGSARLGLVKNFKLRFIELAMRISSGLFKELEAVSYWKRYIFYAY